MPLIPYVEFNTVQLNATFSQLSWDVHLPGMQERGLHFAQISGNSSTRSLFPGADLPCPASKQFDKATLCVTAVTSIAEPFKL
ncbi:hypothetical protein NMY22_g10292 [Coprinellus aureogranulatus]|nr:hypothetical protein NMY22_g10292 [Coprinellus aureogranulatus]